MLSRLLSRKEKDKDLSLPLNEVAMSPELKKQIENFPHRENCLDPALAQDGTDVYALAFLNQLKGNGINAILLAVDHLLKTPDMGFSHWGGAENISHYLVYVPKEGIAIDWTARQFWDDIESPMVMLKDEINNIWKNLPYRMEDSRNHEEY